MGGLPEVEEKAGGGLSPGPVVSHCGHMNKSLLHYERVGSLDDHYPNIYRGL